MKELKAYEIHAAKRKDWKNEKHIRYMLQRRKKMGKIGRIKKHMIRHTCCKDGKIEGHKSIKSSRGKAYETYALQMWGAEWRREDGKVRGLSVIAKSQYRTVMKAGEVGKDLLHTLVPWQLRHKLNYL